MKNLLVRFSLLVLLLSQVGFSFAEEDCCGDAVRAAPLAATITAAKNDGQPPAPVTTVEPQSINLTAPQNEPLLTTEFFLADPTTEHLMQVHLFTERLWPQGSPSAQDNQTLAAVLRRYVKNPSPALLERYLSENVTSPWAGSLSLGLGFLYRQTGFFTQAKTSWMRAWTLLRPVSDVPQLRALADRAAGELALLLSWVGDQDSLGALLEQTRGRQLIGPGGTRLEAASMALSFMRSEPAKTFICGPFGVGTLCRLLNKPSDTTALLAECPATKEGTNLFAVWQLAKQHGLSYRPAQRVGSSDIPLPALVHWSLNHYSVITKQQGDRYLITDQTFDAYQGRELWVTKAALDAEASGYFLIPQNGAKALPSGWLAVSDDQLKHVWGKGFPTSIDPDQGGPNSPAEGGDCGGGIAGMPAYQLYSSQIALGIADMPVGYSPPRGPSVEFILRYNSKESHLPTSPNFSNIGLKWNHNWLSYIVDDPASGPVVSSYQVWNPVTQKYDTFYTVTPAPAAIERFPQGGGYERYTIMLNYYNNDPFSPIVSTGSATPFYRNQNVVERLNNTTYCVTTVERMIYTYSRSDGASSYPRKIMLTSVADRFGNTVTLSYDGSNRITGITDALGQVTTMTYGDSDPTKITRVTDPFGRSANMVYTNGVLTQITDVVGLASSFTYETGGDVINSMTTPYGTTTFARGVVLGSGFEHIRWLEATDPAGDKERMEMAYHYVVGEFPVSDPVADVPTGMAISNLIKYLACYYWDKKAMRSYAGDRTKAKSIGFARKSGNMVTDVREFVKMPNENRVWFNYPGQSMSSDGNVTLNSPSKIGRVIDDGTTQLAQASYNSLGKATETIDPLGRKMGYTYDATGLNLTEVRMTTGGSSDLLMKATYTAQNLPLTVTDANGQNTSYTYNSFGQVLTVTLPARAGQPVEKFTCTYNAQGYLTQIADPLNGTTDFTYDGYGRVQTVKDRDTYTITCDYDNLDRLTKVTFPDGTYTQTSYGRLDAEWSRDREGRWTRMWYDHLRKVVAMRDPLGRVTGLSWCRCGALSSLSDSMGRLTVWNYDTQNRLASKTFPDGKVTSYAYQPKSGRLASQTDAMGQITLYDYFGDNALKQISYPNALIATPTVSYAYDNTYGRLGSMTDGTGLTSFGYASVPTTTPVPAITGAGQLSSIDGPLTNDTATFSYDEWCRTVGSAIGGVGSSVSLDAIGRVKQLANPLGQFQYSYVNATQRLNSIIAPNGMKTIMAYQSLAQDFRVASIRHETSTATRISEHGYVYSPQGRISEWTQQADNATKSVWSYGYDNVDQLTNARATSATSAGALIKEYGWIFDGLGNRLSERFSTSTGNAVGKATYDSVNQLLTTAGGGRTQIKGQIDEPGTVTVNSSPVLVNADKTFTAEVDTQTGSNTFEVKATDLKGNIRTNQFRLDTTLNGSARTLAYDLNGNCTQDGATTYQWDAENRLVSITMGTKRSEFTYDGEGRRVRIVEKDGATTLSDYRFVWLGSTIAERRNAVGDVVQIRYLGAGEIEGTTKRYYTHDHLGSIREVIDQTGGVLARYDYSPFGERIRVGGSAATYDCQFSYTGHFHHGPTGMALTLFRAYSPATGRWLSKDPIGEAGGINLYAYVENSPINYIDPLGLFLGNYMENQRQAVNYNSSDPNRQCGGGAGMDGGAGYGSALLTGLVTGAALSALTWMAPELKILGAIAKGPLHHLATAKNFFSTARGGPWSPRFQDIFKKAGMTLEDAANKVRVPGHYGPHPEIYHDMIEARLLAATSGLKGQAYTNALKAELHAIGVEAQSAGSVLNNLLTTGKP